MVVFLIVSAIAVSCAFSLRKGMFCTKVLSVNIFGLEGGTML